MKALYVKPEMQVIEVEAQTVLAASVEVDMSKATADDKGDMDARGHRGSWGDLWN